MRSKILKTHEVNLEKAIAKITTVDGEVFEISRIGYWDVWSEEIYSTTGLEMLNYYLKNSREFLKITEDHFIPISQIKDIKTYKMDHIAKVNIVRKWWYCFPYTTFEEVK